MRKTYRFVLSLTFAALILFSTGSFAQSIWEKVLTAQNRISVIYFYNANLGFVGTGVPSGTTLMPVLYRTSNSGETWSVATIPGNAGFGINDILMEDENNGWAGSDNRNGRVLRTTDGGLTWNALSKNVQYDQVTNSVRKTSQGLIISDFLRDAIELSSDSGKTFRRVYTAKTSDYVLGMDFVDSVHGVAATTFRSGNKWSYTSDGGLTWLPSNFGTECWTIRGMKGTSTFFAIPEGPSNTDDYLSEVMRSDDYGVSWKKMRTLDFRATSDVEIAGSNLYVQTGSGGCDHCSYPDGKGIYRSTDSGMTWHGIGGPDYWSDSRFAAVRACQGTVVFCSDVYNQVFKILDTAGKYINISDGPLHTSISLRDSITVTPCQTTNTIGRIEIDECYRLVIVSEKIEGQDSQFVSLLHSKLPLVLCGSADSVKIKITFRDSGEYQAYWHIKGYYDYGEKGFVPLDTLIPLHIKIKPAMPRFEVDKNSVIFTISPCQPKHETTLELINKGCDTLTIDSGPGNITPFIFDHIDLPLVLAPSQSKTIRVACNLDSVGTDTISAIFHAKTHYGEQWQVISLFAKKEEKLPRLETDNSRLNFKTVFLCDSVKKEQVTLTNAGCDTVRILSCNKLKPEFALDQIAFPIILPPNASVTVEVYFQPKLSGSYSDSLVFQVKNDFIQSNITVVLLANVQANSPQVSLNNWEINFPAISTCGKPCDTVIVIHNVGCDTLEIVSGPGALPKEFAIKGVSYPIILAPGDSIHFNLTFQPSGSGSFLAIPKFIAERYGVRTPITIYLTGKGIQGLGILETTPKILAFSPANICSPADSLEGSIQNTGCDSLVVDAVTLSESKAFSISSFKLPAYLAPKELIHYTIYSSLRTKGEYKGTITIEAHSANESKTRYKNTTQITASVGDGLRTCSIDHTEIDFGERSLCATPDSQIRITNTGCGTITIASGDVSGNGFILYDISFPLSLEPGKSISIRFTSILDTFGRKGISEGLITFESNTVKSICPVMLRRKNIYPLEHEIMLSNIVKNGIPGDTVDLQIYVSGDFQNIHSLDLDLQYNTDLLGLLKALGPNHTEVSNGHVHISGDPYIISEKGVLATIAFEVFLTNEQFTDIILSNPRLNESEPSYEECIALVKVKENTTRFISSYSCGEQSLSNHMRGNAILSLKPIYPNPAKNSITIEFESKLPQDVLLSINDALGNEKLRKYIAVKNNGIINADISAFGSGIYIARLSCGNAQASVSFIKKD